MAIILGSYLLWKGQLTSVWNSSWKYNRSWVFFGAVSIISITWSSEWPSSLKYNAYVLCGLFIIMIAPYLIKKFHLKPLEILAPIFIIHLVLSLLEIFTPLRWFISEYSSLNTFFGRPSQAYPEFFEHYPTSFFWHQNNCALVTLMALPLILKSQSKFRLAILPLSYLVIFASGSKSIIVLSIIWGGIALISASRLNSFSFKKVLISGFITSLLGLGSFQFLNSEQKSELDQSFQTVLEYIRPSADFLMAKIKGDEFEFEKIHINIRERYYFMDGALELLRQSPIKGAGAGAHLNVTHKVDGTSVQLNSLHNYWLELLTNYGLFVGLYLFAVLQIIRKSKTYRASIILFALGAPVLSSAIYFLPKWLLYALGTTEIMGNDTGGKI